MQVSNFYFVQMLMTLKSKLLQIMLIISKLDVICGISKIPPISLENINKTKDNLWRARN